MIFKFYCGPTDKWTPEALLAGLKLLMEPSGVDEEEFHVDKITWVKMTKYTGYKIKVTSDLGIKKNWRHHQFWITPACVMGEIECQVWIADGYMGSATEEVLRSWESQQRVTV